MNAIDRKKKIAVARASVRFRGGNYGIARIAEKLKNAGAISEISDAFEIRKSKGGLELVLRQKGGFGFVSVSSASAGNRKLPSRYLAAVESMFKADHVDTETAAATVKRQPSPRELNFYSTVFKAGNN